MVPICVEKSEWAVVAMVGVFKVGGKLGPLNPTQPTAGRNNIIAQTRAQIVVSSESCKALLGDGDGSDFGEGEGEE